MADFTVYKTATGIIEHVISSDCDISDIIVESDETVVAGNYSSGGHKFVDGVATVITRPAVDPQD